jgi:FkbM family methyltransferase
MIGMDQNMIDCFRTQMVDSLRELILLYTCGIFIALMVYARWKNQILENLSISHTILKSVQKLPKCEKDPRSWGQKPILPGIVQDLLPRQLSVAAAVKYVQSTFIELNRISSDSAQVLSVAESVILQSLICQSILSLPPDYIIRDLKSWSKLESWWRNHVFRVFISPEVFMYEHGFKSMNKPMLDYIKSKSVIDGGAMTGDSAVVLAPYSQIVFSFEIYPRMYCTQLVPNIKANLQFTNIVPLLLGLGSSNREVRMIDTHSGSTRLPASDQKSGVFVNVTTLDRFVKDRSISVGFIKADVESHGLQVVKGAIQTLTSQRPLFHLSCYHSVEELFEMPFFLFEHLPNFTFQFKMSNDRPTMLFELALFGIPTSFLSNLQKIEV